MARHEAGADVWCCCSVFDVGGCGCRTSQHPPDLSQVPLGCGWCDPYANPAAEDVNPVLPRTEGQQTMRDRQPKLISDVAWLALEFAVACSQLYYGYELFAILFFAVTVVCGFDIGFKLGRDAYTRSPNDHSRTPR